MEETRRIQRTPIDCLAWVWATRYKTRFFCFLLIIWTTWELLAFDWQISSDEINTFILCRSPETKFFFIDFQEIDVGFVSHIYAMRLTHTGEDGFMLYIPSEVSQTTLTLILFNVWFTSTLCAYTISWWNKGKITALSMQGNDEKSDA